MKRVLAALALMALCLCFALGETAIPQYESVGALIMCPSLSSFDAMPSTQLAGEAIGIYRQLHPEAALTDAEIYGMIFANGEFDKTAEAEPLEAFPSRYEIESTTLQPDGSLTLSVRIETDWGFGYEFNLICEITLDPVTLAVTRVFIPD